MDSPHAVTVLKVFLQLKSKVVKSSEQPPDLSPNCEDYPGNWQLAVWHPNRQVQIHIFKNILGGRQKIVISKNLNI